MYIYIHTHFILHGLPLACLTGLRQVMTRKSWMCPGSEWGWLCSWGQPNGHSTSNGIKWCVYITLYHRQSIHI